jgi:hypothetical protein
MTPWGLNWSSWSSDLFRYITSNSVITEIDACVVRLPHVWGHIEIGMLAIHCTANTHNKRDPNNSHVGRQNVLTAILTAYFTTLVATILNTSPKIFTHFSIHNFSHNRKDFDAIL